MMSETKAKSKSEHVSLNHVGEELCGDAVVSHLGMTMERSPSFSRWPRIGRDREHPFDPHLDHARQDDGRRDWDRRKRRMRSRKLCPISLHRGNLAYSTFTIVQVKKDFTFVLLTSTTPNRFSCTKEKRWICIISSSKSAARKFYGPKRKLSLHDVLLLFSDGAVYAGVGETLNFGWTRKEIIAYMEGLYQPEITSQNLASALIDHCDLLYNHREGDDTTAVRD
jgi:hypothetical protein